MFHRTFARTLTLTLALSPAVALTVGGCESDDSVSASDAAEAVTLTVDQVISHHHDAIGGEAQWKAIQSLELQGTVAVGGESHAFKSFRARPNLIRKEGVHDGAPYAKIFDGISGYKKIGDGEFEPIPAEYAAKMAAYAEFDDVLIDHASRGVRVALAGVEEVAGAPAYHLEIAHPSGDVEHRWLDRATFLDVQRKTTYKDKEGAVKDVVSTFSDWREVGGIKINFAAETEHDGERSVLTLREVKVDRSLDPALFSPTPRVAAAE